MGKLVTSWQKARTQQYIELQKSNLGQKMHCNMIFTKRKK
jgi:hypothetical protein